MKRQKRQDSCYESKKNILIFSLLGGMIHICTFLGNIKQVHYTVSSNSDTWVIRTSFGVV